MLEQVIARIQSMLPRREALLVGISGIDSSGKGYVTKELEHQLTARRLRVANINIDAWLNPPSIRFSQDTPAETFYSRGLRLYEMFEQLILPLKKNRNIRLNAKLIRETDSDFHNETYEFSEIEVILLEGVFLFQPRFVPYFDLRCWIECSFEKALARAVERGQEGLPPAETIAAFNRIYFPAQHIHFEKDAPQKAADLILPNEADAPYQ